MPSRYYAEFPERKITAPASKKGPSRGGSPTPASGTPRAWPTKGAKGGPFTPRGATVVKTHMVKAGVSGGVGTTAFYRKGKS